VLRWSSVPERVRPLALLAVACLLPACSDSTGPEEEPREEVREGWLSVDAGTCGLTLGREAFCWGGDASGPFGGPSGRLGTGRQDQLVLSPTPVVGGRRFERISLGSAHTCAVTPEGEAFCWGNNGSRQLGLGQENAREPRIRPAPVTGDLTFERITAGGAHTCALTPDGEAYCWGGNEVGQLGDGTARNNRSFPLPVKGELTFRQISAGRIHTCALTTGGEAFCWGANEVGQLGTGTTTDDQLVPTANPTPVAGDLTFRQIDADSDRTCGITTEGRAFCWGENFAGQLGDGTETDRAAPTPVATELRFEQVSVGFVHTCALTPEGEAFCWGRNIIGTVGDGTTTARLTPVAVSGGLAFRQISTDRGTTCGVTPDDELFCWGSAVGDGTQENRLVPTRIPFPEE